MTAPSETTETSLAVRLREQWKTLIANHGIDVPLLLDAAAIVQAVAEPPYVGNLGVEWCVLHCGIINEDTDICDFAYKDRYGREQSDGDELPCEGRPLFYLDETLTTADVPS